MYSPIKIEEESRELVLKKKINLFSNKCSVENEPKFIIDLLRKTRFNDISDILRTFNDRKDWLKNFSILFKNYNFIRKYVFHFPIIVSFDFFLENYLEKIKQEEHFSIFLKLLHSLLISKKKYKSVDLLTKGIAIKKSAGRVKSTTITIMNHENLFAKKNFNGFQSYLDWLYFSLEKYFVHNYYKGKINFSLGKMALIENKKFRAFSSFLEALEEFDENDFKTRLIVLEWFIFSSLLLKKIKFTNKFSGEFKSFNSKNLFKIKLIYNSIKRNNIILLEHTIFNQKKYFTILDSYYFLAKKILKNIKKKLLKILSVFIRLSMHEISIKLGVSRKSTEKILSYHILKGQKKGYFDIHFRT